MTCAPGRVGVAFGLFLAFLHACWAALVAAGFAQPLMDFVFWAHFITPPYHIEPFALTRAAILVGFVFAVGLAAGWLGGIFWNRFAGAT